MKIKKTIIWKTAKEARWKWLLNPAINVTAILLLYLGMFFANILAGNAGLVEILEQREYLLMQGLDAAPEELAAITKQFTDAVTQILAILIILSAYAIITYSVMQYFIYKVTYEKKFKKTTLWKYIAFNIITISALAAALYYTFLGLRQDVAPIILWAIILAFIMFHSFYNLLFFKEEKIWKTAKHLYMLIISKAHRIIIPILNITALFLIITVFESLISFIIPITIIYIIYILSILLLLTFARYYMRNVLQSEKIKSIFKH